MLHSIKTADARYGGVEIKKKKNYTDTIDFKSENEVITVLGIGDRNLRIIEDMTDVKIIPRGTNLKIVGSREDTMMIYELLTKMRKLAERGLPVEPDEVAYLINSAQRGDGKKSRRGEKYHEEREREEEGETDDEEGEEEIEEKPQPDYIMAAKLRIFPRSDGQRAYINSMRHDAITFCIGPAGTGKTYLAVAMAVNYLSERKMQRIILTRPAVEAGESLGFLPGDLYEKVEPYFRPLYDALFEMLGVERCRKLIEHEVIEVAPLAYMRGRTLNRSFIILDEAQNTTTRQMKMFLTRMGPSSRMVVTGDPTQVDLPSNEPSGLMTAWHLLRSIEGIGFSELGDTDIVRHSLVQKIVEAYDISERKNKEQKNKSSGGQGV